MAQIILIDEAEQYSFDIEDILRIGRHPGNDIPLKDSLVSRWHAEVRHEDDGYKLFDLDSLNGTFVNDKRTEEQKLRNGDRIRIGPYTLYFREVSKSTAPEPSPFLASDIVKPIEEYYSEAPLPTPSGRESSSPKMPKTHAPEHLPILYQVARSLNSSETLDEFLATTMNLIMGIINADRGVIMVLDERGKLRPQISRVKGGEFTGEVHVSSTITKRVLDEKVGLLTLDARQDPRFGGGESISAYNIRSAICVPLWEGKKARGVIYMDNLLMTKAFTEEDLDLLTAIAHQVALGIRHSEMIERAKEEAIARSNLERYHSPDVVNLIMSRSADDQRLELKAKEQEVTILFADIAGFAHLAEHMKPAETANLLSHYFDEMTTVIFKHRGSVNKFIGDAIMALWGAPFSHGNDAELATRCAIEILNTLTRFLKNLDRKKWFKVKIGINTGDVIAGNIGSTNMMEYTVIGDPVNVAARLQEIAEPNQILIGETTFSRVQKLFPTKDLGYAKLKGREEEIKVYEILWEE